LFLRHGCRRFLRQGGIRLSPRGASGGVRRREKARAQYALGY
jgi:hypothetical protein